MADTSIEWTDKTWNPTVGCTRCSSGCRFCYAFEIHDMRHKAYQAGQRVPLQYAKPFIELQMLPDRLPVPLSWRKPCRVFVNSMSDLFHEDVSNEFIAAVFGVMAACEQHTFQVLTKRSERLPEWFQWAESEMQGRYKLPAIIEHAAATVGKTGDDKMADRLCQIANKSVGKHNWPLPNVWLGVSVENRKQGLPRIDILRQTPAAVRFLSIEPLLEPLGEIDFTGIHQAIVGGESGPHRRPFQVEWAADIYRQCREAGAAFFMKQDAGPRPGMQGRIPDWLWRVKEFPKAREE